MSSRVPPEQFAQLSLRRADRHSCCYNAFEICAFDASLWVRGCRSADWLCDLPKVPSQPKKRCSMTIAYQEGDHRLELVYRCT
jgi:hypothetical protein